MSKYCITQIFFTFCAIKEDEVKGLTQKVQPPKQTETRKTYRKQKEKLIPEVQDSKSRKGKEKVRK